MVPMSAQVNTFLKGDTHMAFESVMAQGAVKVAKDDAAHAFVGEVWGKVAENEATKPETGKQGEGGKPGNQEGKVTILKGGQPATEAGDGKTTVLKDGTPAEGGVVILKGGQGDSDAAAQPATQGHPEGSPGKELKSKEKVLNKTKSNNP
jgi:hypothetical protein